MLIDLGRNDVGRVARTGTVRVTEQMVIERYSHVMHIVSHVPGELAPGMRPATCCAPPSPPARSPARPKIRAMEIIEELEPSRRGCTAAPSATSRYTGNLDLAIAIRTLVTQGRHHLRAGGRRHRRRQRAGGRVRGER